jgi:hypothetical protein
MRASRLAAGLSSRGSRYVQDWTSVLEGVEMVGRHSSAVAMRARPEQQARWWLPQAVVLPRRRVACCESVSPNSNGGVWAGIIPGPGSPQPPCQISGVRQPQRCKDPVPPRCWRRFGSAHVPGHNREVDLSRPEPRANILRRTQSSLCAHEEWSRLSGCNAV